MLPLFDDKTEHCLPFILEQVRVRKSEQADASDALPLFVGISGAQGAGKTTLVSSLAKTLTKQGFPSAVLSIDDFYLTHDDQARLTSDHPSNPLIQHRGQPSTHDLQLALSVFSALRKGTKTRIPMYDKSAYSGQGDRAPLEDWHTVNDEGDEKIKVVILEGWCLGFRALTEEEVRQSWDLAVRQRDKGDYKGRLGWNSLESIQYVNNALKRYDDITNQLDAFIHIDAEDPLYVYAWRLEQEASLRTTKGSGMSDEQVVDFVNGYYPSYELFTDKLRAGLYNGGKERQLRLVIDGNRKVKEVSRI